MAMTARAEAGDVGRLDPVVESEAGGFGVQALHLDQAWLHSRLVSSCSTLKAFTRTPVPSGLGGVRVSGPAPRVGRQALSIGSADHLPCPNVVASGSLPLLAADGFPAPSLAPLVAAVRRFHAHSDPPPFFVSSYLSGSSRGVESRELAGPPMA